MLTNAHKTPPAMPTQLKMTPKGTKTNTTPLSHFSDVDRVKLVKDLNSPSASVRVRALNALKTPNKHKRYSVFDVPHEEQELVTEQERKEAAEVKPKTIQEVFAPTRLYVEVRSGEDDLTEGIKSVLRQMGATINETLVKSTTHVVFKEGLLSSYTKAKKMGIPVVSVLWIEACKKLSILADTSKYPISNLERYENPELYKRMRRPKVMTPKFSNDRPSRYSIASTVMPKKEESVPVEEKNETKDEENNNKTVINTPVAINMTPKVQRRQTIHIATPRPMDVKETDVTLKAETNIWKKAVDNINRVVELEKSIKYEEESSQIPTIDLISPKKEETRVVNKRRTLFTPEPYFKPTLATPKDTKPVNKRRTLFTPSHVVMPPTKKSTQRRRTLLPSTDTKLHPPKPLIKLVSSKSTPAQITKSVKRKLDADTKENTPPRPKIKPFLTPSGKQRSFVQASVKITAPVASETPPVSKRRRTLFMPADVEIISVKSSL